MAYRALGTAVTTPTTSPSMSMPASVAAGETLVAFFTADGTAVTMSAPAGWTMLGGTHLEITADTQRCWVFWKQATGLEGSTAFTSTGNVTGVVGVWTQRHATLTINRWSSLSSATSALAPASTAYGTATDAECDEIWFAVADDGDVTITWTPPSGFTERIELQGTGNNFHQFTIATRDAVASGASGAYTGARTGFGGGNGVFAIALAVGDTSTLSQEKYRFFNNDGVSESTSTGAAAENAGITAPATSPRILRTLLDAAGNPGSYAHQLEWKLSTDATWRAVLAAQPSTSLPTFVAKGAFNSNAAASSLAMPAGIQNNDLLLAFVETANQALPTVPPAGGWLQAPSSPQSTGTAAAAGGVRLYVFYKVTTGTESALAITDSGDHFAGIVMAFRGVDPTNPFNTSAGSVRTPAATAVSMPGVTTTVPNALIVHALGLDKDLADADTIVSLPTNAALANIAERHDQSIATGVGGGIAVYTGEKATAGATGTTSATTDTSTTLAMITLALAPAPVTLHKVLLAPSANIAPGGATATTARLTPPGAKTTSAFGGGSISDDTNPLPALDLPTDGYGELAWCVQPVATEVVDGNVLEFRVTQGGVALASYPQTPTWTIGSAAASGTGQAILGPLAASGAGTAPSMGTGVALLGALLAVASGTAPIQGSGVGVLGALTAVGTGSVGATVTGTGLAQLGALTAAGAGSVPTQGAGVAQLGALAASGAGTAPTMGAGVAVLGTLTTAGAGTAPPVGSGLAVLGALTAAGVGTAPTQGAGVVTLGALLSIAAGNAPTLGTGVAVLGALGATGGGTTGTTIAAAGVALLAPLSASGAGIAPTMGGGTALFGALASAGAGSAPTLGHGVAVLGAVTGVGDGTVPTLGAGVAVLGPLVATGGDAPRFVQLTGSVAWSPSITGTIAFAPAVSGVLAFAPALSGTLTLSPYQDIGHMTAFGVDPDIIPPGATVIARLEELKNEWDSTPTLPVWVEAGATVRVTLYDRDENPVPGCTDIACAFQSVEAGARARGTWRALVEIPETLTKGKHYKGRGHAVLAGGAKMVFTQPVTIGDVEV